MGFRIPKVLLLYHLDFYSKCPLVCYMVFPADARFCLSLKSPETHVKRPKMRFWAPQAPKSRHLTRRRRAPCAGIARGRELERAEGVGVGVAPKARTFLGFFSPKKILGIFPRLSFFPRLIFSKTFLESNLTLSHASSPRGGGFDRCSRDTLSQTCHGARAPLPP